MSDEDRVHFGRVADDNDTPSERGTYRRILEYWADHFARMGKPNANWAELCCPDCGRIQHLGDNHKVADDGTVEPSVVCPFTVDRCSFHRYIKLDVWASSSTPSRPRNPPP